MDTIRISFILGVAGCIGCSSPSRDNETTFATQGSSASATQAMSESDTSGGTEGTTGDSGISDTQTTTGAGEGSSGMNCGEATFVLEAIPPNVMLVLDKSGSMLTVWDQDGDGTDDGTRWNSLHSVVEFVTTTFNDTINFGAVLFPSEDAEPEFGELACTTNTEPEVSVAPTNSLGVLSGIPGANSSSLFGATPATRGLQAAIDELKGLDPTVPRVVVLVTDGAANCSAAADLSDCPSAGPGCELMELYDSDFPALVSSANDDDNISTFVVGIDITDALQGVGTDGAPEANTFDELNTVAVAGGHPRGGDEKFFNTQNELELMDALEQIAGQVVSCTIPLTPEPENPGFVEIEIDGETVAPVTDCASEDGWMYTNPDGPYDTIELCGTACDIFGVFGNLDAIYACPPAG